MTDVAPASVPVVVDTDPGLDDALALLLAFRIPGWRIEAITTVAGNVPVAVGTENAARVVGVVGPAFAPLLASGAVAPRARALVTATRI
ncbi:MAG: nucleoside hydrolase, partial [Candidatus Rokuibacteriota bacterium]